jgi:hypothetical protein
VRASRLLRVGVQHPLQAFFLGAGLTALVSDLGVLLLHRQAAMLPIAYLGAVLVTVSVFWRWRTGRFHADIARALATPAPAPDWLLCGAVLIIQVALLKVLPALARSAPVVPCMCLSVRAGQAMLGLTLVGYMVAMFEAWVLWSAVLLVLRRRSA